MPTTLRVRHSPQVHDVAKGSSLNDSCGHSPRRQTSVLITCFVTSGAISGPTLEADTIHLDPGPRIKRLRRS
jgi:hypothetical protein